MSDRCRSCNAPIEWALTEKGRRMPVDAEPVEHGNITLSHRQQGKPPVAVYNSPAEIEEKRKQAATRGETARFFLSHFATCSHPERHRKRKKDRSSSNQ